MINIKHGKQHAVSVGEGWRGGEKERKREKEGGRGGGVGWPYHVRGVLVHNFNSYRH